MSALDNRIAAQKRKITALDDRIGRLMSARVEQWDKLAGLYEQRARKEPLT